MKLKRPRQRYPLVEVWWDDPTGLKDGWIQKMDEIKPALVLSIGWLVHEEPDYYIIAQDSDSEGNHNGRTQLPKTAVKKMKVLRPADPEKVLSNISTSHSVEPTTPS